MEKIYKFESEDIQKINLDDYSDDEFAVARVGYLSTRPNSHELVISEDVLRESASSVLGKWMVCEIRFGDAGTHSKNQVIVGRIPENQEVEFIYDDDGYLRAYVEAVISKIYAKDYCKLFEDENKRSVSVEMWVDTPEDDEHDVLGFNIVGVTTLGKKIRPSCPESDVTMIRFSEEDADSYFAKIHKDRLTDLEKFAKESNKMAEPKYTNHPISKSKDDIYTGEWDGQKAKEDLIKEKNFKTLAPKVCMKLEEGWEDREITKLGYPVMTLHEGKWVYSTKGLASALGYAKKENETTVVSKIEKIYKDLGLDEKEGKEETKMEIEFAVVDIGDLWGRLWHEIDEARHWEYGIVGIYEEDNQKFAILCDRDKKLYRLDFSLTEDGMTVAEEAVEVKQEFVETDNIKKFAEPENVADYRLAEPEKKDDESEDKDDGEEDEKDEGHVEMSVDECLEKITKLEADIEERDHIIMDKDTELEELRAFKKGIEDKEKAVSIESVLAEIKGCVDDTKMAELRSEGMTYEFANLDAWSNKVKAMAFEATKSTDEHKETMFRCAAPVSEKKKSANVWERIKNNI